MVKTETTGAGPDAEAPELPPTGRDGEATGAEVGYGAGAVPFWYGDGIAETTGAVVAITG